MRTLLLGDIGNRMDIEDAEADIAMIRRTNRELRTSIAAKGHHIGRLESELARQKLAIEALTRFLVAKGVVDQSELEAFIAEVDAEDGVTDGRLAIDPKSGRLKLKIPGRPSGG